jgi:ferredoxin-type protein NapG
MNEPQSEKSSPPPPQPPESTPLTPPPPLRSEKRDVAAASAGGVPVTRKPKVVAPKERRDFFSDAMKEVLSPFAGVLERKINPLLEAIEAIPQQAERLANLDTRALDQLHGRNVSLPMKKAASKPQIDRYLRPPGAMAPGEFETVCSRCGKCVEACPADAIQLDPNHLTAYGFPYIVPQDQACVVCDELACMKSCPTGALKLVDRLQIKMGTAKVDHSLCLRDRGENCTLCVDVCPITSSEGLAAIFASPITGKIIVRKNICVGCGLCENRCPTEPPAITVMPHQPRVDPIIA